MSSLFAGDVSGATQAAIETPIRVKAST